MVTEEEKKFIAYWQKERTRKKRYLRNLSVGLPLGVAIVLALFFSSLSGWYTRADMVLRSNGSVIAVIVVAAIAIVVFITVFSSRHQWDQYEQQYQQLLQKQAAEDAAASSSQTSN